MLTNGNTNIGDAVRLAQSYVVITPEQKALIAAELASDPAKQGYAGQIPEQQVQLLCIPQSVPNPVAMVPVVRESILSDECYNILASNVSDQGVPYWLVLKGAAASNPYAEMVTETVSRPAFSITLGTSQVVGIIESLVPSIIPQAVADLILTQPDPSYQASSQQSRMEAIGLAGFTPLAGEWL